MIEFEFPELERKNYQWNFGNNLKIKGSHDQKLYRFLLIKDKVYNLKSD